MDTVKVSITPKAKVVKISQHVVHLSPKEKTLTVGYLLNITLQVCTM
jgi:hypothetical protein